MQTGLRLGPHWEAYRAPRPPIWFSGSRFAAGNGRKGGKEENGRVIVPPLLSSR